MNKNQFAMVTRTCDGDPDTPDITASELQTLCGTVPAAVERTKVSLSAQYYECLAEKTFGPKWKDGIPDEETYRLLKSAQEELDCLHQTSRSLLQSYQAVAEMEDELRARLRDVHTSRDRRWYMPKSPSNAGIDLSEQRMNHFAQGLSIYKLLLIFFVGSFAGVVVEMLWEFARYGVVESRQGLVYGPFNSLYGAGAVCLTLVLWRFRNRGRHWSFLGGFLVGSALEYMCSWGQETLLGSRSWDYSHMPLNINGRICLTYSVFWGLLGIVWIKDLYPRMAKWILKIPNKAGHWLTWLLTVFMIVNIIISCVAVFRWSQRVDDKPPSNTFWELVDRRFPSERMERIYATMTFVD